MRKTAAYAFHHSIPILIGFFPVGIAYGLLMQQAGYNFLWSGACSLFVLAGSLQFLMVTFFAGGVSLATVAVLALLLNSRHIFYGLSFIDKFRSFGPWRWFLIYSLCDENYSLHCSHDFGPDVNEKWAYVLTAALVTFYWVALSMLGGLVGSLITFDTTASTLRSRRCSRSSWSISCAARARASPPWSRPYRASVRCCCSGRTSSCCHPCS